MELALGFSVTGYGRPEELFRKGGLREGEVLLLTKALGSGALLAAAMRGECPAESFGRLKLSLLQSNGEAARILAKLGVKSCTDVTGFGLAGHLLEMLDASRVSCELWASTFPLFRGFRETVENGILSTLHPHNAKLASRVRGEDEPGAELFDPQTAGGLLFSLPREQAGEALRLLHAEGYRATCVIGEVTAQEPGQRPAIFLKKTAPHSPRILSRALGEKKTGTPCEESPGAEILPN
jgi:selenide,water dikinase